MHPNNLDETLTSTSQNLFKQLTGHLSDLIRIILEERSTRFSTPIDSLHLRKFHYVSDEKQEGRYSMHCIIRVGALGQRHAEETLGLTFIVSQGPHS